MKKRCLIFLLFLPVALFADSFYSSRGLGLVNYFSSSRSVGMGGASMAVRERMSLNPINPAAIHIDGLTSISADYQFESVDSESREGKVNTRDGRPAGFKFVVPLYYQLNLITSLTPLQSSKYTLALKNSDSELDYERKVVGHGGISSGNFGVVYHFGKRLSVAGLLNFYFGTHNEEWKTDFTSTFYVDGTDEITSHFRGVGGSAAIFYQLSSNFGLGAVYKSGTTLNVETKTTLDSNYDTPVSALSVKYPDAVGAGFAWKVRKVLMAGDFYLQRWSNYRVAGIDSEKLKTFWHAGGGIEYNDTENVFAPYRRRMFYRLGAYMAQLSMQTVSGEAINEHFISAGVGLPFHGNRGRIDLAIEIGQRGDLESGFFKETIARFSGTISASELWFHRPVR
ncbi:hypothetical protein JW992_03555 [candidate division KSB1 bacterium]|nr:hypothetical protein [candidate division KSB1 bacterium]